MTWTMESNEKVSAVKVICSGNLSADDLTMLAIEASFLVRQHGYMRVLIDLSEARADFPAPKLPTLLDIYAEHHLPRTLQSGIVLGARNAALDLSKLLAAAEEYGYEVDVLADTEQSEAWLSRAD